ncbi:MAG TPA: hypothetical protein VK471_00940 [Solirubrobacterales bacterium]|nr:hypothetical protein [Solirubrobacterales bacterium]
MSQSAIAQRHHFDRTSSPGRRAHLLAIALLGLIAIATLTPPRAAAFSDREELTSFGSEGSGAGQFREPRQIATDPTTGHVFIADNNNRINEFTPWGTFVKAFGWDVAPGAVNEQQEVRVRAAEGQFKLSFGASTTADLAFDAPGSESEGPESVEAALNALASIGGAGGEVSVEAVVPGAPDGRTPYVYVIAFKGSLAATNVAAITAVNGTTPLSGGDPSTSLDVRTRADGTVGGTGLESCTEESGCKAALSGSGPGEFDSGSLGIGVDSAGNIYVKEINNLRVQKFDSAGRFVLMFGGEVDKTTHENLCTATSGHECGGGIPGTTAGEFSSGFSQGLALGPGGQLFAVDKDRIQRFNLQGEFQAAIPVPGETVEFLAFDPVSEDLYATYSYSGSTGVHKLDSITGAELGKLEGQNFVATDPAGNVYAWNWPNVLQYDAAGKPLAPPICCAASPRPDDPNLLFNLNGFGTNTVGDFYVPYGASPVASFIRLLGPGPVSFEAPPKVPPEIVAQFATSVDRTGAVLSAEINPHFWNNTHFYLQYGTGKCSEGGCVSEKPLPPGALLTTKPFSGALKSSGVFLEGLEPGTTYHYRFVAESSGGGPVRGVGGKVGVDGGESTFTTYPASALDKTDCPNQAFRTGFSAPLPDCRAYEMVSPIDKNNGDIRALVTFPGEPTDLEQSSLDGNKFTYSSYRAFAGAKAGAYTSQYIAKREQGVGWATEPIAPPQSHGAAYSANISAALTATYRAFSDDLCNSWLIAAAEPVLAPGVPDGYYQPYRRDNCGPGGYEALAPVQPTVDPVRFSVEIQGASADGKVAIFRVKDKLTEDAAGGAWQTYYSRGGQLRLVCVLPNGLPSGGNCSGGTGSPNGRESVSELNYLASVTNAISSDGARVYWTDSGSKASGLGKVYVRLNPGEEQSAMSGGECTEAEKACTLEVSETESTKASEFLGASTDGAKALFEVREGAQAGNLYLFDLASGESTLIAKKAGHPLQGGPFAPGVLGASEDLSHVYFVSEEALAETSGATVGEPNLYLDQDGVKTFIATLARDDVAEAGLFSNTSSQPFYHSARVSPDGSRIAFFSTASPTGYDNTDQASGEKDTEVYLYRTGSPGPVCVSCNPSGARPLGRFVKVKSNEQAGLPLAAMIPPAQFTLHFPRSLSEDGERLFFTSYDALVPRDTNGKADVYLWEAASGPQDCEQLGADLHVAAPGGCLSLITSGQSPDDSRLLEATPDGNDVFFTTNASLLPQDPGLIDIYDARVNGGLPGPPEPPGPCQGEACQFVPPAPLDPTPASASFRGVGNPSAKAPRGRCAKGKARHKGRCVAKHKRAKKSARHKRAANHDRRQSR